MTRVVCIALLSLLMLVAACKSGSSASQPTPTSHPTPARTIPAGHGRALGIGEPRIPQPYTVDQRLLDAVSNDDRRTIELALERGAKLSAKDDIGRSVVLRAVLDAGNLDLVRWLHDKGAALDEADAGGRTALSFAAANGRLDLVRYLVENGAAVNRVDVQRRPPLFHAAIGGHLEVATFLLDHGANPNLQDQFGDTPLMVACAKGYGTVAELLLQHGADAALKDEEGRTARERAAPGTEPCSRPAPNTP